MIFCSGRIQSAIRHAFCLALAASGACVIGRAQSLPDFEQPPVEYSRAVPRDVIAQLQERLAAGRVMLGDNEQEILRSILRELQVRVESQVLVFSKTSLQRGRIRPDQPRAIYFSDTVYVGWVPGGLIEATAIDPYLGPVFYAFDPRGQRGAKHAFQRETDCLRCHGGNFVRDIPGVFVRSVIPDSGGEPLLRHGTELVDDRTPFERRWGGWYVTGYTGAANHRGNRFGAEQGEELSFPLNDRRPRDVSALFDVTRYPAATSDVVALLVLEHQLGVQNALTHAAQHCRKMLDYQRSLQTTLGDPLTDEPSYDSVKSVFASAVESVVDRLLFRDAATLPAGIVGAPEFQKSFGASVPRAGSGQSLKDLKLDGRLFERRCSYLIYSEMFMSLPAQLKNRILDRLYDALRTAAPGGRYGYLAADEKREIFEILQQTLPAAQVRWAGRISESSGNR